MKGDGFIHAATTAFGLPLTAGAVFGQMETSSRKPTPGFLVELSADCVAERVVS